MTTEDNSHGYDELRWLAKDTQKRRRRAIWQTGGLVLGSIALATAYVAREPQSNPVGPVVSVDLGELPASLTNINNSLDGIRRALEAQEPVSLTLNWEGATVTPSDPSIYVNRVIWLVEGSRRFPMTRGDILWIPEADRWLKLETIGTEPAEEGPRTQIEVWRPNTPPLSTAVRYELPKQLPATRNTASCVLISSLGPTKRPGFPTDEYVDIDVYFLPASNDGCRD